MSTTADYVRDALDGRGLPQIPHGHRCTPDRSAGPQRRRFGGVCGRGRIERHCVHHAHRGGPGEPGAQILQQPDASCITAASDVPADFRDFNIMLLQREFIGDRDAGEPDNYAAMAKKLEALWQRRKAQAPLSQMKPGIKITDRGRGFMPSAAHAAALTSAWMRHFLAYDPYPSCSTSVVRSSLVNGGRDLQVSARRKSSSHRGGARGRRQQGLFASWSCRA